MLGTPAEPWHSLYAHLMAEIGWPTLAASFSALEIFARLAGTARAALDEKFAAKTAPLASSCALLFDAVAAAVGLCFEQKTHASEALDKLEALARTAWNDDDLAYPFAIPRLGRGGLPYVEPVAMWNALLGDLILDTPPAVIAARFHRGLANVISALAGKVAGPDKGIATVTLSGRCFDNRLLHDEVARRLRASGFIVPGPKGNPSCVSVSRVES